MSTPEKALQTEIPEGAAYMLKAVLNGHDDNETPAKVRIGEEYTLRCSVIGLKTAPLNSEGLHVGILVHSTQSRAIIPLQSQIILLPEADKENGIDFKVVYQPFLTRTNIETAMKMADQIKQQHNPSYRPNDIVIFYYSHENNRLLGSFTLAVDVTEE